MRDYKEIRMLLTKFLKYLGLDEASSSVYSALVLDGERLTVSEIVKNTSYSVARVYASLSNLLENGLVEKYKENGTVKYSANLNFVELFEIRRSVIMGDYLKPLIEISAKYNSDKNIKSLGKYVKNMYKYFQYLNKKMEEYKKHELSHQD